MSALPLAARIYVGSVITAGAVLLAVFFPVDALEPDGLWLFLLMLVLSSATSVFKVNLPLARSGSTMSVSYAVDFASLLLLGPHETMIVAAASAYTQCTFRIKEPNPVHRTLFSMACLIVTVQAAGTAYILLGGTPGRIAFASLPKPLVGAATTYFVVNTLAIATAIALSTKQPVVRVWHENFLWSAPSYFVGAGAAAIASWMIVGLSVHWLATLAAAPLYLTYRTYKVYLGRIEDEQRHTREMADLHLATIEALALAIDAKDQTSQSHIRRVQLYAASVARALGMSDKDVQGVKTAALLHDIGKLAVPEHILSKPGPLTPEEFQKIRAHPKVGADIVSSVPFPYPVAPLILSHHERWDGKGYPSGLKGEEIPLGARVLSVVDYFDALMAERPYHKAMSSEAAIGLLKQEAGKGLDPVVVAKFIELLPALEAEAGELEQSMRKTAADTGPHSLGEPATGLAPEAGKKNVFEDIALAHREIYALYEIAQAMGTSLGVSDTMALITAKLSNLVPFSCAALFLFDEDTETIQCRFASGTDADVIQQITVRTGDGLTGWVARNRRPLVNARPSADLDASGLGMLSTTLQSALVCPLLFNDRFIGALAVYHLEPMFYREDHRRLLDRVSEQAAAVIHNSIIFEQTRDDSLTDPLTGLPNTRFLFLHLTRDLARAERLQSEVSLMVMDLDQFKDVNDNYGHHVGDRALCEIARILRAGIRPYDICVRYAGDEFILVLSGCGASEAEEKRRELQQAIDDTFLEVRPGRRIRLGVSIGTAIFPHDGDTYESLLATADSRMYQNKAARKQRSSDTALPPGNDVPPIGRTAAGML
ncbi:MAG TPA: HD domain-containing phosphohydrolase [Vicinamibacterales bacterium]|nr:HD domain-containing phosphohydrolase [Vicinamibacterales bacterium]